jgi:hypothetical protein
MNSLSGINNKSMENLPPPGSINSNYPSFFNTIPPMNFSFVPPAVSIPSNSTSSRRKRSIPSSKKHSRLTVQLRNEILKLKGNKPTIFVWEIQQNLLQNGICTAQTLPHVNFQSFKNLQKKFFFCFVFIGYNYSTNS